MDSHAFSARFRLSQRWRSLIRRHPYMCDLRFVLLGKNETELSKVRKLILHGNEEALEHNVENTIKRIQGTVKGRHVTIINPLYLLNPNISDPQITQTVRECVYLCHPGPHVFILTLQYRDFTEEDVRRVKYVLNKFSEEAMRRTIIITTDEETNTSPEIKLSAVHQFIDECRGGHLELEDQNTEIQSEIFKRVKKILKRSQEEYLTCEINEDVKETSVDEEQSRSEEEKRKSSSHKDNGKRNSQSEQNLFLSANFSGHQKLNLVLCGSDTTLIVSVSKLFLREKTSSSHERAASHVCVKKEEKIAGRLLSLVELPALSRLSEEEVMRQTLCSVTLCDPGVHAFIIIVPARPLNNDEQSEIEKILKIFDSREHFMVLFTTDKTRDDTRVTGYIKHSPDSRSLISRCGGHYRLMWLRDPEHSRQIPDLLDYIENVKTEPYSLQMYVKALENRIREETEVKYKEELKRREDKIKELQVKGQSGEGVKDEVDNRNCLRIVLIGRTGSGKSATGNTILGRTEFRSQLSTDSVTTVCEKRVGEVDGRSVAVVDTPGLFDTTLNNEQVAEEIMKCVSLSSPGPHVFLIVLSLGRFTKEEMETLDLIKKIFGPKAAQFSIVLFTRGDELKNKSIQDYVRESKSANLTKMMRDCRNRFFVLNNNDNQNRTQVTQLLKMIEQLKHTNQGRYFTNSMFEEAEMSIEKMKRKHEEEIKEMKRKHDDEARKQAEEFKESTDRKLKHVLELTEMLKEWEEQHK